MGGKKSLFQFEIARNDLVTTDFHSVKLRYEKCWIRFEFTWSDDGPYYEKCFMCMSNDEKLVDNADDQRW